MSLVKYNFYLYCKIFIILYSETLDPPAKAMVAIILGWSYFWGSSVYI